MCDHGDQIVVAMPTWLRDATGRNGDTVSLDRCAAHTIMDLWGRGIATLSHCCGHGEDLPSLVIPSGDDPAVVLYALRDIDEREWRVFQWRLMDVTAEPCAPYSPDEVRLRGEREEVGR